MLSQRELAEEQEEKKNVNSILYSSISNLPFALNGLKQLTLSHHQMGRKVFMSLMAELRDCHHLKKLDLSHNLIYLDGTDMKFAERKLKALPKLKEVDLSDNYIASSANFYLKKDKSFKLRCFSFFKLKKTVHFISKPLQVGRASRTVPQLEVSEGRWVLSFSAKKRSCHAMLLLEGLWENGQRFIERYHLTVAQGERVGRIKADVYNPEDFETEKYHSRSFSISKEQGVRLRASVNEQLDAILPYGFFGEGGSSNHINCVDWCLRELRGVGIFVEKTFIPLPANVIKGSNCIIC